MSPFLCPILSQFTIAWAFISKWHVWPSILGKGRAPLGYIKEKVVKHSCSTYTGWTGCLVVAGRGVWTLTVSVAFSAGRLCGWSLWKGFVPGWTRLRPPPSRMYTCSGATSSQRGPWKPERHTQVCGRLQEPRFWQGGWQSAEERAQMDIMFSRRSCKNMCPPCTEEWQQKWFSLISTPGLTLNWLNQGAISFTPRPFLSFPFSREPGGAVMFNFAWVLNCPV